MYLTLAVTVQRLGIAALVELLSHIQLSIQNTNIYLLGLLRT